MLIFLLPLLVIAFTMVAVFESGVYVDSDNVSRSSVFTVIIDAGHGGMDSGTSADDGTAEKDINLAVSRKLNTIFLSAGYNTVMLRKDDNLIGDNSLETVRARKISDIRKRLSIVGEYPDCLLVSIHQNHYSVEKYNGAQVFYSSNSRFSREYALSVQNSFRQLLQPDNTRQIKAVGTDIYLMYNCNSPAIMVECGFLSNKNEAELLKNDSYQTKVALAIFNGIINNLE